MSSSTSPANSTGPRTDEEVKHSEEGVEEVNALSAFDRLPDEVVVEILRDAVHSLYRGTGHKLLLVSRRFQYLTRPLFYSCFSFDTPNQTVLRHPEVSTLVESITYSANIANEEAAVLEGLALGFFVSLTSLTIKFYEDDEQFHSGSLSTGLTGSLRSLKHLKDFTVVPVDDYQFEDASFSLARDLPQLRQLHLQWPSSGFRELFSPPPPLTSLYLYGVDNPAGVYELLPWFSLVSLDILLKPESPHEHPLSLFTESLQRALCPFQNELTPVKLPLRHFSLADSFELGLPPAPFRLRSEDLQPFFRTFALTSTKEATFQYSLALRCLKPLPVIPSVVKLTLEDSTGEGVSTSNDLSSLRDFLHAFPSLRHLKLKRTRFTSALDHTQRSQIDPSSVDFLFLQPTLSSLLTFLRQSPLLSFTWVAERIRYESYRWVRAAPDEDFQVDRYSKF